MATNVLGGLQYIQQQIESGRQQGLARRYNRLAGEAFNAPDEATRNAAIGQIAVNNPDAATKLRTGYQAQDDTRARRAANVAKSMLDAVKSGNPAMIQGTWRAVRPFLSEMNPGAQIPEQWTPEMEASLHQAVAEASGLGGTNADLVQSTRIGADGYYYTVDRTGNWTNSGIKADPRTQLRDQPGVTPGIVDLRTGTVSGLQEGGQQPTPGGQPQPGPVSVGTGVGGVHMNIEGLDPERQRRLAQTLSFMQQAGYPGEEIDAFLQGQLSARRDVGPSAIGSPPQSGPAAMRPATPPAGEVESFGQPQAVVGPDGQQRFVQFGNRGGVREVPGYNAAPTSTVTAADRKAVQQAQQKLPQLQNAIRGMDRIGNALAQLRGGMVNTGPMDQYYTRYTKEGQELEAAVGAIQNSMLALTRVPGIGSQSDLEQRVAMLQYPSLDKDPAVNARTLENLRLFMADLKAAYDNLIGTAGPAGQQHGASATHPSGWSIQVEN